MDLFSSSRTTEVIPSSCPEEKSVIPESQQSAHIPDVVKNQAKPKQQRKEEVNITIALEQQQQQQQKFVVVVVASHVFPV